MKRWLFVGKSDKRDLLLYLCGILAAAKRRVLLIDATEGGKYRYSIGEMAAKLSVAEFSGFDVAAGIREAKAAARPSIQEMKGVAGAYDYVLYDLESLDSLTSEHFESADQIVWVTSFDRYEVESTAEWFRRLFHLWPELKGMRVRPVYVRTVDSFLNYDYIMGSMDGLPIEWNPEKIKIPWNETNMALQLENDHSHKLRMKGISRPYKKALFTLLGDLDDMEWRTARRAFRQAGRRRA